MIVNDYFKQIVVKFYFRIFKSNFSGICFIACSVQLFVTHFFVTIACCAVFIRTRGLVFFIVDLEHVALSDSVIDVRLLTVGNDYSWGY